VLKVNLVLRPFDEQTATRVKQRSGNNINPEVHISTDIGQHLTEVLGVLAKQFKEDATSIVLILGATNHPEVLGQRKLKRKRQDEPTTFLLERCKENELTVADLITDDCTLSLATEERDEVFLSILACYQIIDR
jgi:hypothetical protein